MAELIKDYWHLIAFGLTVYGGLIKVMRDTHQLRRELDTVKKSHVGHLDSATEERFAIHSEIGSLKVSNARTEEKFVAIMATLAEIRTDLAHLRSRD